MSKRFNEDTELEQFKEMNVKAQSSCKHPKNKKQFYNTTKNSKNR